MNENARLVLLIGLLTLATMGALASPGKTGPNNKPIETMLAGYTIEKQDYVALRDPRSGYYLIRSSVDDGGFVHVALCVDLKTAQTWLRGHKSDFHTGHLRSLQTGRGVRIGDTPRQVRRIMGRPTWQGSSQYSSGESVWSYHHIQGRPLERVEYVTLFRFRKGRVTGIELDLNNEAG